MKTEDFKKILKPLIEKTIKEVLLQEGVLSRVVSEVARGMQTTIVESNSSNSRPTQNKMTEEQKFELLEEQRKQDLERKRRLLDATGIKGVNVFEGTRQTSDSGNPHSALSGVSPSDAGVDITAIQKLSRGKWSRLAGDKNG
tara:strand:- start:510 stop:935 length:426 start_codon:yes stop_codon:yes gene_type:complete